MGAGLNTFIRKEANQSQLKKKLIEYNWYKNTMLANNCLTHILDGKSNLRIKFNGIAIVHDITIAIFFFMK